MKAGFSESVDTAVRSVREHFDGRPGIGIILGSGLSEVAAAFGGVEVPFASIEGYPRATVAGHRGSAFLSERYAVMAGRFHFYEGHDMDKVVLPVFLLHALGVRRLIVTNAAGGINPGFHKVDKFFAECIC